MKIKCSHYCWWSKHGLAMPKRSEGGMATVIFIALLAIMMILVTAEGRALHHLRREVKILEQQQIKRLNPAPTNTATLPTARTK